MSDEKKQAAIYVRTNGGQAGLKVQIEQCKAHAELTEYAIDERHIYQEIQSGTVHPRDKAQFRALLEAAQRQEFTVVFVTSYDRLSRNLLAAAWAMTKLQELGIEVIEVHQ